MKAEYELKNATIAEKNTLIAVLVNSGYHVYWETKKVSNVKRKVLVVDDRKGDNNC